MRLNEKKFYELASSKGLEAAAITTHKAFALSCGVFRGEVNSLTTSDSFVLVAKGIKDGKMGSVRTEVVDKGTPEFLIDGIINTATVVEKEDKAIIFKGSEKYHKRNNYNPNALSGDLSKKIEVLLEIERKLKAYSPKISEVASVEYEEAASEGTLSNSYGLKLKDKFAEYVYVAEVVASEGEETKTGFSVFVSNDPNEFDVDKFVKEVAEDAIGKLGSTQCKSKKYPVVLNPKSASSLLAFFLNSIDAEEVQKQSSALAGKLHQPVASKKVTVIEDPLAKTLTCRYYDDEGVATYKKTLINKGNLETYIYTLETAAREGVAPTGNGYGAGSKAHASLCNAYLKAGKKSEQEMMSKIKLGVYITELEGLHAGMNAQSGNFSLQAQGFMIRDGKLAEPLSLITLAGNLFELFMDVKDVSNTYQQHMPRDVSAPSILIKSLAVSGK